MKLFDLTSQVAIVTGSSRGIGLAVAEAFIEAGARVAISSRNLAHCTEATERLNNQYGPGKAFPCAADLADKSSLERLVTETRAVLGPINILVCNAATNPHFGTTATISDQDFRSTLEDNILANHWLVQMCVPDMIARKNGAIVLISSVGSTTGSLMTGVYNMAKAALEQMARNLALEYGPSNIRVNGIAPGSTRTEFAKPLWDDPEKAKKLIDATVLGRIADPREIAGPVLMMASQAGSFTTGQTLLVDGGRLAWRS